MIKAYRWRLCGIALAAGFASACAGDGATTSPTMRNPNSWSFAQGIMDRGPMLVEVRGEPYTTDQQVVGETVARAMERAITWSAGARFTPRKEEAASPTFRVVTTFNGPIGLGSNENCADGAQGGGPLPEGQVRMLMTFCDGADVISNVSGHIGRSTGIADPEFTDLIYQATRDLFPPRGFDPRGTGFGVGVGIGSGGVGIGSGGGGVGWGIGF
ncbi:MAG TPA: hypothetical protein VLR47_04200 [Rhodospirillales bacterium]|nr:hypothetical protein [Rhodospirillales bacterium]